MICTWRDWRAVLARCFRCGVAVETTAHFRGKIYCPACRASRRRESARAANQRFRAKRRRQRPDGEEPDARALPGAWTGPPG